MLEYVTPDKLLSRPGSEGASAESLEGHKDLGSGTPQAGRQLDSFADEPQTDNTPENLPLNDATSSSSEQNPDRELPDLPLTESKLSADEPGHDQKDDSGASVILGGEKPKGEQPPQDHLSRFVDDRNPRSSAQKFKARSILHGKLMRDDPDLEPVLHSVSTRRTDGIRDPAPSTWSVRDREKYHQVELQALLGGPIPADIQNVIRELGHASCDGWLRAVIRQVFRPLPSTWFSKCCLPKETLRRASGLPFFSGACPWQRGESFNANFCKQHGSPFPKAISLLGVYFSNQEKFC